MVERDELPLDDGEVVGLLSAWKALPIHSRVCSAILRVEAVETEDLLGARTEDHLGPANSVVYRTEMSVKGSDDHISFPQTGFKSGRDVPELDGYPCDIVCQLHTELLCNRVTTP